MSLIRNILQITDIPLKTALNKLQSIFFKKINIKFSKNLLSDIINFYVPNDNLIFFKTNFENINDEHRKNVIDISDNIQLGYYYIFNNKCNVLISESSRLYKKPEEQNQHTPSPSPEGSSPSKSLRDKINTPSIPFQKGVSPPLEEFGDALSLSKWLRSLRFGQYSLPDYSNNDIKVPWEIGRMHELVFCALAYKYTGDEKHYKYVIDEINNFMINNPLGSAPQWVSGMDVSIRLINVMFALDILKTTKLQSEINNNNELKKFIISHIEFINEHSEWSDGMRGNHYLTNLVATIIYLVHSADDIQAKHLENAVDKLILELHHQFYDDGGNFESSTYYHSLASELVLWAYYYLSFVKSKFAEDKFELIRYRIFNLYEFFRAYYIKDGTLFQIGDNDGGKIINFRCYDSNENKTYILELFEFVLNIKPNNFYSDFLINNFEAANFKSKDYTVNSYGLIWRNDKFTFALRNGKKGQNGKGGHDHSDQNSITLEVEGTQFILDPGTFSYTGYPYERDKYRSINFHNTLVINDVEQYYYLNENSDDLFWAFGIIDTNINQLAENKYECTTAYPFNKSIPNLLRNTNSIRHKRIVEFLENNIMINDVSDNQYEKKLNLHFAPNIILMQDKNKIIATTMNKQIEITFPDNNLQILNYDYSISYLNKSPAIKCVYTSNARSINWEIKIE